METPFGGSQGAEGAVDPYVDGCRTLIGILNVTFQVTHISFQYNLVNLLRISINTDHRPGDMYESRSTVKVFMVFPFT